MQQMSYSADIAPTIAHAGPNRRTVASYERELAAHRCTEIQLRKALAQDDELLRQKDKLIQNEQLLSRESDHRLLNGLQIIVSLISLQSRASANSEAASQLAVAAKRVAMIERVHRRLHCLDGLQTVGFKQNIVDLCHDFSAMLSSEDGLERDIVVEAVEAKLPAVTAIPLGFIVSELITNAAKYGQGRIFVRLERNPEKGFALSVYNDGPALPEEFDPAACKGLGMKIIRSLVAQIGGELRFGPGDKNQGVRFTVLFSN